MTIAQPVIHPGLIPNLTLFDWFLVAILATSTIAAFMRGLIRSIFSVAGILTGILIASWYYPSGALYLTSWISQVGIAQAISFVLIILFVVIVFAIMGRLTRSAADAIGLGFMDRLGGAAFGLFRGFLLLSALIILLAAFLPPTTLLDRSQLSPYFLTGAHGISFILPNDFKDRIADGAHRLQQSAQSWHLRTR